jgi:uncharacterized membrane protein YbaN (DUF454 family)
MKKVFWYIVGMFCLGMAYVGLVTPGIPFSIFLVMAAYAFSKSSDRMHNWIYSHKRFGPFLTNWKEYRVFPTKMKYVMIFVMSSTLLFTYVSTGNIAAVTYSGIFMLLVAIWAWRYPSSIEEYNTRKQNGKKIAWLQ